MFLSELHELMPPKLFSKLFGETINKLLDAVNELGLEVANVSVNGLNPTVLRFSTLGGAVDEGAHDAEVKAYLKQVKKLALETFRTAKIQVPNVSVKFGTDMAGDAEIDVACTWMWGEHPPGMVAAILSAAIDASYEAEVEL